MVNSEESTAAQSIEAEGTCAPQPIASDGEQTLRLESVDATTHSSTHLSHSQPLSQIAWVGHEHMDRPCSQLSAHRGAQLTGPGESAKRSATGGALDLELA